MGDKTVIVQPVQAQFENTKVPLVGEMSLADPSLQQTMDDERLIPNIGDSREMKQQGTIYAPDGITKIHCELTLKRIRNKDMGVDVICIVPCLAMVPDMNFGKG